MKWEDKIYEGLKGGRYGGNPFSPTKSHVHGGGSTSTIMSTQRDESGKLWLIYKDKDGKEISRKPGKEIKK
jgi:hypothetical protein